MPRVHYSTLVPTEDTVTYADVTYYPDSNIADTTGVLHVAKLYGFQLDALEVASSGKISFTVADQHSLDMATGDGSVDLRARNSNALRLANEDGTAAARFEDDGSASVSTLAALALTSGSTLTVTAAGGLAFTSATASLSAASNVSVVAGSGLQLTSGADMSLSSAARLLLASAGSNHVSMGIDGLAVSLPSGNEAHGLSSGAAFNLTVGDKLALTINGTGATLSNQLFVNGSAEFNGPALVVPRGNVTDRPSAPKNGTVFYNEEFARFEGYASNVWSPLGGVMDSDQNTYITAELSSGVNDNTLRFVVDGSEAARIGSNGFVGIGTGSPQYMLDVAGDVRVAGEITLSATGGSTHQITPKVFVAGVDQGDSNVVDGIVNNGAGLRVAGLPEGVAQNSAYAGRFDKSLTWHYGVDGMRSLGSGAGVSNEAYWEMQGGAFHMSHVNPDTGSKVSLVMRMNNRDQLEFVKRVQKSASLLPTYTTIALFGNRADEIVRDVGYANINMLNSFINTTALPYTISADVTTFQAYDTYRVYAALYPVFQAPTSAEVMAAASAGNGYLSGVLDGGVDHRSQGLSFSAMADGTSIPDALNKLAIVIQHEASGAISSSPYTGYIINNSEFFDSVENLINNVIASDSNSTVTFTISFSMYNWTSLSEQDKIEFGAFVRQQIIDTFNRASYTVSQVDVLLVASAAPRGLNGAGGSRAGEGVDAVITLVMPAGQTNVVLNTAIETPLLLIGDQFDVTLTDAGSTVIELAPNPAPVPSAYILGAKPPLPVVTVVDASGSNISLAVAASAPNQSIIAVYVYTSSAPISASAPSSLVKRDAQNSYTLSQLSAGPVSVATGPMTSTYIYVVSENSYGILSDVVTHASKALTLNFPSGVSVDAASGLRNLVSQTTDYMVQLKADITADSSAAGGSAYLLLYSDSNQVPASAADALAAVLAGTSNANASITKM